jgi:hypothetical protein
MGFYGRSEYVLAGLWLAGFDVDPSVAKAAWIARIRHDQLRLQKQATRYSGGFWGLVRRWVKKSPLATEQDELFGELLEWRYDDENRDSEAFRLHIVESFAGPISAARSSGVPKSDRYAFVERAWQTIQPETLFVPAKVISFLETVTPEEMSIVTPDLRKVREILQEMFSKHPSSDRFFNLRMTSRLMGDLLGPVVIGVIRLRRMDIKLPLSESLDALNEYFREVQWIDLNYNENNGFEPTRRAQKLWVIARRKLRLAWSMDASIPSPPAHTRTG